MRGFIVFACVVALAFAQDSREDREGGHHPRGPHSREGHRSSSEEDTRDGMMPGRKPLPGMRRIPPFWMPNPGHSLCEFETSGCATKCSNGFQTNQDGCPICECVVDPCESMKCGEKEICHVMPCLEHPCKTPKAKCIMNSICHDDRAYRQDLADVMLEHNKKEIAEKMKKAMKLPTCNEKGKYEPTQCEMTKEGKMCWCVTPFGEEIEGTRVPVHRAEELPSCIAQRTQAAEITFTMKHTFYDEAANKLETVKSQLMIEIPAWLMEDKHIVSINVMIHDPEHFLVVILIQGKDEATDCTEAVHHIGRQIRKDYAVDVAGKKVEAEPQTLHMKHQDKGEREETWGEFGCRNFRKYYHRHPIIFVVGPILGLLFVAIAISSVCLVCCRKRRLARAQFAHKQFDVQQKSDMYKQNIVLGHTEDEKKVALA